MLDDYVNPSGTRATSEPDDVPDTHRQSPYTTSSPVKESESLGSLFAKLSAHGSTLFRSEIELVKLEAKEKATKSAIGIAMFLAAGALAFFAIGVLITTAILGLTNVVSPWLAALIVALALLLLAGALIVIGKNILTSKGVIRPPVKERVKTDLQAAGLAKKKSDNGEDS